MPVYTTVSCRSIFTSMELGKGGEGIVYDISGYPDQVAKIYHLSHRTLEKERKLQAMIASPPQDDGRRMSPPHISIAWPIELLYEQRQFAGYLMPRIGQSSDIFEVYNPQLRAKNYPSFNWRYLHRTARNFATALNALHVRGYVMGDVNQKNILVTTNALITLVDTDSFQVPDSSGQTYRCPVGVPEYTPPELQGTRLDSINRTIHHDNFGLAVIIFQLLMEGFHPFTGTPRNPALSLPGEVYLYCIKQGIFPYRSNHQFNPPPRAPNFSAIHPKIQKLFLRCFVKGHLNPSLRPMAYEWIEALDKAEKVLIQCGKNHSHWYSNHTKRCQWCEQEKQKPLSVQQGLPSISTSTPKTQIPTQIPIQIPTPNYTHSPNYPLRFLLFVLVLIAIITIGLYYNDYNKMHLNRNASLSKPSPSGEIRAWQQNWGSDIVGVVTTRPCLSLPIWRKNIDKEISKNFEFLSYSMMPTNRLKQQEDAWYTRNDGYAVTVIGCWSPSTHKIFFFRKSDAKKWQQNNFYINEHWEEINFVSRNPRHP